MNYEEAFFDELVQIEKEAGIGGFLGGGALGTLAGGAAGLLTGGPAGAIMGAVGGGAIGSAAGGLIGGRRMARAATTGAGALAGSALGPMGTVGGAYMGSRLFRKKPVAAPRAAAPRSLPGTPRLQAGPMY